ncbi:MAG TPA: sensor histidine kinase [Casimicrobiaceae bacterium]|jgi:two-component system sensor histidine kinase TctE|nr:sensor histidine kinase [Casimicrobiaceae bacterium]
MPSPNPSATIRRRLLWFLIPPILLVVGAAVLTCYIALRAATAAYDRSLLDPALDLAASVSIGLDGPHLNLLRQAQETLLSDHEDRLVFQIRAPGGAVIAGDDALDLPPSLAPGERMFFDSRYQGQPVRVATVRTESGLYVQVAETLHKRHHLIAEILAAGLLPAVLIALAMLVLGWTGVAQGIAPLAWIRTQLLGRSPHDFHPLDANATPEEIAPAIEALNRLLAQVRESNEMQQRFLANAAHQLRTPLAGLQMHLELLLRRELTPDVRTEISGMHLATVRASHLANQLLALAKAEASADDYAQLATVDLYAVADGVVHEWVQRAIARDIDLGFDLEHTPVAGNPVLLAELLGNLLDNALRYTPRGGSVTVRCGSERGQPFLSVEDNGPGIPESARGRVFERFYRVHDTPGDGAGLGLAIVKEVVQGHRGALQIESPAERGTRIVVRFPPAPPETASAAA